MPRLLGGQINHNTQAMIHEILDCCLKEINSVIVKAN